MKFYTSVKKYGNAILHRYVEDGAAHSSRVQYEPTLFVVSDKDTGWSTLKGIGVAPKRFDSISDARKFISQFEGVGRDIVHGNTDFETMFIHEEYEGDVSFDFSKIRRFVIDIEVDARNGFPTPDKAADPISAITVFDTQTEQFHIFSHIVDHFDSEFVNTTFYAAKGERDLITSFVSFWEKNYPDVVTGWNIDGFDIPYLINRITNVYSEQFAKRLSPWNMIVGREGKNSFGQQTTEYKIVGIESLDYLELYKKFVPKNQESYRLGYIATEELGETKIEFDGDLTDLLLNDPHKYLDYNQQDVNLVNKLDQKMQLLMLCCTVAYMMKVNFKDALSTVRPWTSLITAELLKENRVIDAYHRPMVDTEYEGAYVKQPIPGKYKWVATLDATSMYPHMIMGSNISPETKIQEPPETLMDIFASNLVETIERGEFPHSEFLKDVDLCMAANGQFYRKDSIGILPRLVKNIFEARKAKKKEMLALKSKRIDREREGANSDELRQMDERIRSLDVMQNSLKIAINSVYGATGNKHFPLYDLDNAAAITLSGQAGIRYVAAELSKRLSAMIGLKEQKDFVIYIDTDSLAVDLQPIVDRIGLTDTGSKAIDAVCTFVDTRINKMTKEICETFADKLNWMWPSLIFKREKICTAGIYLAKKRYMLYVHDSEGVRYAEPEVAITGLETNRSSTPKMVRSALEEVFTKALIEDESSVRLFVSEFRDKFFSSSCDDISFPRGINDIGKYADTKSVYKKGTPIHVRGAIIFNYHCNRLGLGLKYKQIKSGDKIRFVYLRTPNPFHENIIAWNTHLPPEFAIEQYVDYDLQFEKVFMQPLKNVLDTIGWKAEETITLDDFFG